MVKASLLTDLREQAENDGVQQLVVGAVVAHGESVLLLRRPADDFMAGIFELPSGKVEADEALDVALCREVAEETGLRITGIGEYLGSFDYRSGSGRLTRQFTFVVTVASVEHVALTEHDAYQWAPPGGRPPVTDAVFQLLDHFYCQTRDTHS